MSWRDQAACRPGQPVDPEWFFVPDDTSKKGRQLVGRAKAICDQCPVLAECRAECDRVEGLDRKNAAHLFGIFGGETERERVRRRLMLVAVA